MHVKLLRMTIALTFARRRLLGFSAASVLLHAMVLGWAGAELGPEPDQDSAAVQPMMALLLAPPVARLIPPNFSQYLPKNKGAVSANYGRPRQPHAGILQGY